MDQNKNSAPKKSVFSSRKFKYGATATVFALLFIAAVIVLNVIVSAIDSKYPLYVDLTEDKLFTVSDSSVEMIRARFDEWKENTGEDLKITIMFMRPRDTLVAAGGQYNWVATLAESYANEFDQIEVEYREDLVTHPENYVDYTRLGETLRADSIIMHTNSGKASYKVFNFDSCLVYDEEGQNVWAFKGEMRFNSAILEITNRYSPVVTFTKGHGESIPQNLLDIFYTCGFRVQEVDLAVEDISDDTKILVISNPVKDFLASENDSVASEYTKLSNYLNDYRSAIVTLAPPSSGTQEELKNLYEILDAWGLKINRNAVIMDNSYSDPKDNTRLYVRYAESEGVPSSLTGSLTAYTNPPRTLSVYTAPIEVDPDWGDGGQTAAAEPVLITSENAYIEVTGEEGEMKREYGEYTAMAISSRFTYVDNARVYGHLLLIGTNQFSETAAYQGQFGNTEILYNTIRLMSNENVAVDQNYKVLEDYTLTIESGSMYAFAAVTVVAIPVAIFTLGVVVYVRRKHL